MSHNVYILREIGGKRTYVGYTTNLERRIRQHNCEIKGGAKCTSGRKWEYLGYLTGFPDNIIALQCEWKIKHPMGRKRSSGIEGRLEAVRYIFSQEKMTSNSIILNKDLNLKFYLREEYFPVELPKNIEICILNPVMKNIIENCCENTLKNCENKGD